MRKFTLTNLDMTFAILSVVCLCLLAGCSAMPTNSAGGGGYGANADLLPPKPNTPTDQTSPPPTAQLAMLVRATTADETRMTLDITKVELEYFEVKDTQKIARWYTLADGKALKNALPALPFKVETNGAIVLLCDGPVPVKSYTAVRISLDQKGTTFTNKAGVKPLSLATDTFALGDWTLDTKSTNDIVVSLDGVSITSEKNMTTSSLAASAITLVKGTAQGSISGKLSPAVGNAKIEAYWGESKVAMASAVAKTDDGSFTIPNLPPGPYKLNIIATGYHPTQALKPTMVETTNTDLGAIALSADATH